MDISPNSSPFFSILGETRISGGFVISAKCKSMNIQFPQKVQSGKAVIIETSPKQSEAQWSHAHRNTGNQFDIAGALVCASTRGRFALSLVWPPGIFRVSISLRAPLLRGAAA